MIVWKNEILISSNLRRLVSQNLCGGNRYAKGQPQGIALTKFYQKKTLIFLFFQKNVVSL
jgi:hypothetical protein